MRNVADYFTPTTNTEKEVRSKLKEGRGGEKNKRGKGSKANRSKETKRNTECKMEKERQKHSRIE